MDASEPGPPEIDRRPATFLAGGLAAAAVSLALAAIAGPPYLALSGLNPWIVVFAIALFAALFASPFAIHRAARRRCSRATRAGSGRSWGGARRPLGVLAIGLLFGLPSGFSSTSLAGSIGLVAVVESALVLGTLVLWLLSN